MIKRALLLFISLFVFLGLVLLVGGSCVYDLTTLYSLGVVMIALGFALFACALVLLIVLLESSK